MLLKIEVKFLNTIFSLVFDTKIKGDLSYHFLWHQFNYRSINFNFLCCDWSIKNKVFKCLKFLECLSSFIECNQYIETFEEGILKTVQPTVLKQLSGKKSPFQLLKYSLLNWT